MRERWNLRETEEDPGGGGPQAHFSKDVSLSKTTRWGGNHEVGVRRDKSVIDQ